MTHDEKRTWIRLIASVVAYGVYVAIILGRADGRPLPDVPYATALVLTVVGAIVASVVVETVLGVLNPRASRARDVRDREIARLGDHIGQSFVVIGAVAGMLMAMVEWEPFWIANVIYLCFALSAVLGGVAKIVMYRRSLPQW